MVCTIAHFFGHGKGSGSALKCWNMKVGCLFIRKLKSIELHVTSIHTDMLLIIICNI